MFFLLFSAKQIIMTGAKCLELAEFEFHLGEEIPDFGFPSELLAIMFEIINGNEQSDFSVDAYEKRLDINTVVMETNISSISETATEGRARVLDAVVKSVSAWSEFLSVLDVIIKRARQARLPVAEALKTRKRLGKHIAHVFSTISYSTASAVEAASWNAESAQASYVY